MDAMLQNWKDKLISLMISEDIKDFSDEEIYRVCGGCVGAPRCIFYAHELINQRLLSLDEVVTTCQENHIYP